VSALDVLVRRARRRMRVNRALGVAGWALPLAGGAALSWAVISRAVVLPEVDRWVGIALVCAVVGAVVAAAVVKIPAVWAAWAADTWLASRDRFATAVELAGAGPVAGLAARQVATAERDAAGVQRFPTGPRIPVRLLAGGAAAALVAAALGSLPNPQDAVRAARAAERAAVAAQAEALREKAAALREETAQQDLAERLEQLAAELERQSIEGAVEQLAEERADLAALTDPSEPSQRTALAGLDRELDAHPLAPGASVAEQLESLANQLEQGTRAANEGLAERLRDLQQALAEGAPEVAEALGQAAEAAAAGEGSPSAEALREASEALDQAAASLAEQEALASADQALAAAQAALQGAPPPGEAQQEAEMPMPAAGSQAAPPGVNPQQQGTQGDPAEAGTGAGSPGGSNLDLQTVYDPPGRATADGEDVRLDGQPSAEGPATDRGRTEGGGARGTPLVPYLDVLPEYADEASRTIERPGYPPRLRGTVQDYFDRLGAAS
jgi:hypothetical protein